MTIAYVVAAIFLAFALSMSAVGKLTRMLTPVCARETECMGSDYGDRVQELADSIWLGYAAEAEDPNFSVASLSDADVRWLAHWLVSEGWTRSPDWK